MQTVTPGASQQEVTPIADGTWHFGGDWESVDEQAAVAGLVRAVRTVVGVPFGSDQANEDVAPVQSKVVGALGLSHLEKVA